MQFFTRSWVYMVCCILLTWLIDLFVLDNSDLDEVIRARSSLIAPENNVDPLRAQSIRNCLTKDIFSIDQTFSAYTARNWPNMTFNPTCTIYNYP